MVILVVHHFVEDFGRWKAVFDEHEPVRRGHGEVEHRVYQDIHNPNRVVVHNDFRSEEEARGFMGDPSLPAVMERAGVTGEPGIGIAERVEQERYADGEVGLTLVVHHPVRDYAVWKPVFDGHEGSRRGHGVLEHRIYRYPGDERSVVIHLDLPSEAAADAFLADPSLQEAMERGGVEGEPGTGRIRCTERKVY
jgi:quinol monooxygenase YgiN